MVRGLVSETSLVGMNDDEKQGFRDEGASKRRQGTHARATLR